MEQESENGSQEPDVIEDERYTTEGRAIRRILDKDLEAIVWRYRSIETYTHLYDHLSGTCEIRIKLSKSPPETPGSKRD